MIVTLSVAVAVAACVLVALHRAPRYTDWRYGIETLSEPPPRPLVKFVLAPGVTRFIEGMNETARLVGEAMERAMKALREGRLHFRAPEPVTLTTSEIMALRREFGVAPRLGDGTIGKLCGVPIKEVPDPPLALPNPYPLPFEPHRVFVAPLDTPMPDDDPFERNRFATRDLMPHYDFRPPFRFVIDHDTPPMSPPIFIPDDIDWSVDPADLPPRHRYRTSQEDEALVQAAEAREREADVRPFREKLDELIERLEAENAL